MRKPEPDKYEATRNAVAAAREKRLAELVVMNAGLAKALSELMEACDDDTLDDREADGYRAALDRQSLAMKAAEEALSKHNAGYPELAP